MLIDYDTQVSSIPSLVPVGSVVCENLIEMLTEAYRRQHT